MTWKVQRTVRPSSFDVARVFGGLRGSSDDDYRSVDDVGQRFRAAVVTTAPAVGSCGTYPS